VLGEQVVHVSRWRSRREVHGDHQAVAVAEAKPTVRVILDRVSALVHQRVVVELVSVEAVAVEPYPDLE
jgi:hypothetical protein